MKLLAFIFEQPSYYGKGVYETFCSKYIIFDNNKICKSANEIILPRLNINSSSSNVRLILLLLSHI